MEELLTRAEQRCSETTQAVLDHRGSTERLKDLRGGQISECLDILRDTNETSSASPLNLPLARGSEFDTCFL